MKRRSLLARAALFAGAIIPALLSPTAFSQLKHLSTEELVTSSDIVAVGKVRRTESAWNSNRTRIETSVTVELSEVLKGNAGGSLIVTTPGGEVGGVGELYTHSARFEKDEEVVIFAKRDRSNRWQVTGGSSGKQKVSVDPATGERSVGGKRKLAEFISDVKNAVRGNQ